MRLLCRSIRLRVTRADGDVAEIERLQNAADAALIQHNEKTGNNALAQIAQPPAHNTILRRVRSLTNPCRQDGFLLIRQLGRSAATMRPVRQTGHALCIVADHPVAQCLTVHSAGPRRFGPRAAVPNHSQGEQPARHFRIRLPRCTHAQLLRAVL